MSQSLLLNEQERLLNCWSQSTESGTYSVLLVPLIREVANACDEMSDKWIISKDILPENWQIWVQTLRSLVELGSLLPPIQADGGVSNDDQNQFINVDLYLNNKAIHAEIMDFGVRNLKKLKEQTQQRRVALPMPQNSPIQVVHRVSTPPSTRVHKQTNTVTTIQIITDFLMGQVQSLFPLFEQDVLRNISIDQVREIVHTIVFAHLTNTFDHQPLGAAKIRFTVQINGDVQRGKSAVEALIGFTVRLFFLYCEENSMSFRPFTLLGTVQVPWADSLFHGVTDRVNSQSILPVLTSDEEEIESDDENDKSEDDEGFELAEENAAAEERASDVLGYLQNADIVNCPVTTACTQSTRNHVQRNQEICDTIDAGGVVVFARNISQIRCVLKAVLSRSKTDIVIRKKLITSMVVVLDEADSMYGSCSFTAQYERCLGRLTGELSSIEDDPIEKKRCCPVIVFEVSATNYLCFFRQLINNESKLRQLLKVISFQPSTIDNYIGPRNLTPFRSDSQDRYLQQNTRNGGGNRDFTPMENDSCVCKVLVEMALEVANTPFACMIDCLPTFVAANGSRGMVPHAYRLTTEVKHESKEEQQPNVVYVFVTGTNTVFNGMLGLMFTTGEQSTACCDELNRRLMSLGIAEESSALLEIGVGNDQEKLRPLLQDLENRIAGHRLAQGNTYHRRIPAGNKKLNTSTLSLLLFLIRDAYEGIPVIVIGNRMLKRCLSIVAVDPFTSVVTLCVTHTAVNPTYNANLPDALQQIARGCTTLTSFHQAHGFTGIKLLTTTDAWKYIDSIIEYNRMFDDEDFKNQIIAAQRDVYDGGVSRLQAFIDNIQLPESIRSLLKHPNPFHRKAVDIRENSLRIVEGQGSREFAMRNGYSSDIQIDEDDLQDSYRDQHARKKSAAEVVPEGRNLRLPDAAVALKSRLLALLRRCGEHDQGLTLEQIMTDINSNQKQCELSILRYALGNMVKDQLVTVSESSSGSSYYKLLKRKRTYAEC